MGINEIHYGEKRTFLMTADEIKRLNISICKCGDRLQNDKCKKCERETNNKTETVR